MAQLYTSDQLVRFVYRETGILQSLEIENALATDAEGFVCTTQQHLRCYFAL
jgi:hypothetical protein